MLNTQMHALVAPYPFLTLLSSSELYPASQGVGLPLLKLDTPLCSAVIALQGAQLMEFSSKSGRPLLWVSPKCNFTPGTALRGGVPICLPWFGPHPSDATKPKHGFARNQDWQLYNAALQDDGTAELIFRFNHLSDDLFAQNFTADLKMRLGTSARLTITITNTDQRTFACSWVLHSYYRVDSLSKARVRGLTEKTYLDNLQGHAEKLQVEDVVFAAEVDRVFPDIDNSLNIEGSPRIAITHHNCPSVVVWNPGAENAAKMSDVGAGNEQHYICVERGAVRQEQWDIKPGESRTAWMEFKEVG